VVIWSDTSITAIFTKYKNLATDTPLDVSIQPKEPKSAAPIDLTGAFTMRNPMLDQGTYAGSPEQSVTINGMWFGTKKGQVYVNGQKCKITAWSMNPATGESTLTFIVHKQIVSGTWGLEVVNKIGRGAALITVD
jgi:hypothetical protein